MIGLSVRYSETDYELNFGFYANDLRRMWEGSLFGTRHHPAATYDGVTRHLCLDGMESTSDNTSDLAIGKEIDFKIGIRENSFRTALDDVRICSRILDAQEIADLYRNTFCQPTAVSDTTLYAVSSADFEAPPPRGHLAGYRHPEKHGRLRQHRQPPRPFRLSAQPLYRHPHHPGQPNGI